MATVIRQLISIAGGAVGCKASLSWGHSVLSTLAALEERVVVDDSLSDWTKRQKKVTDSAHYPFFRLVFFSVFSKNKLANQHFSDVIKV